MKRKAREKGSWADEVMLKMGEGHVSVLLGHLHDLNTSQTQPEGGKAALGSWFQRDIRPQLQREELVVWAPRSVADIESASQRPLTWR